MAHIKFDEYRFHFKPENENGLFAEEIMSNKNETFSEILSKDFEIEFRGKKLNYLLHKLGENTFYFRPNRD